MKYLLLFLALCGLAKATNYTAATCSRADVVTAIGLASDGDTVIIPAGTTSDWTTAVTITKAIVLIGSGFSNNATEAQPELYSWGTTLLDGMSGVSSMITFNLPAGKTGRVSQINFQGNDISRSGGEPGCIAFTGYGQYRLDHCKFTLPVTRNVSLQGAATGVSDHCWHHNKNSWHPYHFKNGDTVAGLTNGNGAWSEPSTIGTADNWFVENCYFSSLSSWTVGICDSWNGGKGVMRFNRSGSVYQLHYSNHGTESPANYRSGRMLEIYKNVWTSTTNHSRLLEMRGGTGVHWGNIITMPSTSSMSLNSYRADGSSDPPHGPADGTYAWDTADLSDSFGAPNDGIFETGTAIVANCLNRAATAGATITQSGTTITCSAPLFTSSMVGKWVRWTSNPAGVTTTHALITAFTDSTHVTVGSLYNRLRAVPSTFVVGDASILTDPTKAWGSNDWAKYTVRTIRSFTGTSGTATSVTVTGAGWTTDQWKNYNITRISTGLKGSVLNNTTDTINLRTDFYQPSFASGVLDFQLSQSGRITSNTGQALTLTDQHDTNFVFTDNTDFEIRRNTFIMDQPGAGPSNIPSPESKPPPQNLSQGHTEPIYNWNNAYNGTLINVSSGYYNVQSERDYFNGVSLAEQTTTTSPFNGSVGVGMGTLANRPTSGLTTGVGYWATDVGEWDSTNGATPDGQLYVATSPTTWAVYYTPYTFPHPLTNSAPSITSASVSGTTLSLVFNKSVTGVSAADFALSGSTLSAATGSGTSWTITVSPTTEHGTTYTLNYTAGGVTDGTTPMASFSGLVPTNNNSVPSVRNPGRSNVKKGLF